MKIEIPVDGYDDEARSGVMDYTLYCENGEVLAMVEAKKTAVDVRLAEAPSRTTDLYEPLLDMFGTDAVERWFTEREVTEIIKFAERLSL